MAEQTEKDFLKQPKVFLYSKKSGKGKRPEKRGNRFWKYIGLGYKTPCESIEVRNVLSLALFPPEIRTIFEDLFLCVDSLCRFVACTKCPLIYNACKLPDSYMSMPTTTVAHLCTQVPQMCIIVLMGGFIMNVNDLKQHEQNCTIQPLNINQINQNTLSNDIKPLYIVQ
ncbi:40S ribosomal protein S11, N-terminal [Dillenia turbinata]|uniref:40S ribosomal protein S11, N-terminal n=1 Tax=Dillenia turbinata TaxID=194707 RepID=A0AAN8VI94_9MAGN